MTEPRVLVRQSGGKTSGPMVPDTETGWKWVGWVGLALSVVGLWDFALTWYPLNIGSPEWEFATVTASYSGLPLPTVGLIALIASAMARGVRWQVALLSLVLFALGVALVLGFVLYLTTVPMALRAVEGVALIGIQKAVAKTAMLGIVFPGTYIASGIVGLRTALRRGSRPPSA